MDTTGFIHRFEKGRANERPLLLLHGTGGDENDLLPLARMIAPTTSLLSPRGKVLENGMRRFFRRLAEGVFDEDDVRRRANELADFVTNGRAMVSPRRSRWAIPMAQISRRLCSFCGQGSLQVQSCCEQCRLWPTLIPSSWMARRF